MGIMYAIPASNVISHIEQTNFQCETHECTFRSFPSAKQLLEPKAQDLPMRGKIFYAFNTLTINNNIQP